jgi:hypothetical protein
MLFELDSFIRAQGEHAPSYGTGEFSVAAAIMNYVLFKHIAKPSARMRAKCSAWAKCLG